VGRKTRADLQGIRISDLLGRASLLQAVSDTARLDAEVILAHVLNKPRTFLYIWPERQPDQLQVQKFDGLLQRRLAGEPIAYLVGNKEFWSLSIEVNTDTLIPRPETELVVEKALALINEPVARVLDLGTGTGAIALALASERPGWQILAVDLLPSAVALATRNCRILGFSNVSVKQGDWYNELVDGRRFDLIVSNPPYIASEDPHLSKGDVCFEPASALVSADSGLADLKIIIGGASGHLVSGGWLILEHGFTQGEKVRQLLATHHFVEVNTCVDMAGRERVSFGRYRS
jgi:release factor glutamine methyltransferase